MAALAVFVALVWLRMPQIMRHGRFWAEEGRDYFANAWNLPWWRALTATDVGYLNLTANVAAVLARYLVPLEQAPHVTTAMALCLQALPAILLVTAADAWLARPHALLAAILLLAMPPGSEEVWLNTPNSQFHVAAAAGICLALDARSGRNTGYKAVFLVLAPLCSPATMALAPLFLARAAWERTRPRVMLASSIGLGTLVQAGVFLSRSANPGHLLQLPSLVSMVAVKNLAIPFLGTAIAGYVADRLRWDVVSGVFPVAAFLAAGIAGALLLAAILIRRRPAPLWLLLAGVALAAISYSAALGSGPDLIAPIAANRYAIAPSMLFGLCVISIAATGRDRLAWLAWAITAWLLAVAVIQTVLPQNPVFKSGPSWRAEIAKWRADPSHPIAIWPSGWVVHLSRPGA